jgi:hypothetical protein
MSLKQQLGEYLIHEWKITAKLGRPQKPASFVVLGPLPVNVPGDTASARAPSHASDLELF